MFFDFCRAVEYSSEKNIGGAPTTEVDDIPERKPSTLSQWLMGFLENSNFCQTKGPLTKLKEQAFSDYVESILNIQKQ